MNETRPMIKGMRHVGIVVRDLDAMLAFYRDLLGLEVEVDFRETGEFIDTVQGLAGVNVRMVKLALGDGTLVELLHDEGHPADALLRLRLCDPGLTHFAVTVDDVADVHAKWVEAGLEVASAPVTSPDGKARLFFGRDPEGNLLELVEELET